MSSSPDPSAPPRSVSHEVKSPDDFAALHDIHEGGVMPAWKSMPLWGGVAFSVALVVGIWAAWRHAPAPRPPAPVPAAAPSTAASMATLIIRTDAPCELAKVGEPSMLLKPGESREISVAPGEHTINCVSTEDPAVRTAQIRQVDPDTRVLVNLQLAAAVSAQRQGSAISDHR